MAARPPFSVRSAIAILDMPDPDPTKARALQLLGSGLFRSQPVDELKAYSKPAPLRSAPSALCLMMVGSASATMTTRRLYRDWEVDPRKYPDGLQPLIDHIHAEGMTFGIWFEPEMINMESDTLQVASRLVAWRTGSNPRPSAICAQYGLVRCAQAFV